MEIGNERPSRRVELEHNADVGEGGGSGGVEGGDAKKTSQLACCTVALLHAATSFKSCHEPVIELCDGS